MSHFVARRHLMVMGAVFHAGELEAQRLADVVDEAHAVGRIIGDSISAPAARFLTRQRLAIASTTDSQGRVWASPLTGPPGFLSAVDSGMLWSSGQPVAGDPLRETLATSAPIGLLVIDPRTRQRMRFNGRGLLTAEGVFVEVAQVYGNCPKYIQLRAEVEDGKAVAEAPLVSPQLNAAQRSWIEATDTMFIATAHPQAGADASHRGGRPGFIEVEGPTRLSFPDYQGNNMFNTLGNLLVNPNAGLLFIDFEHGHILQLTGTACVVAERRIAFDISESRETRNALALRYRFLEYSPAHPDSCHTAL